MQANNITILTGILFFIHFGNVKDILPVIVADWGPSPWIYQFVWHKTLLFKIIKIISEVYFKAHIQSRYKWGEWMQDLLFLFWRFYWPLCLSRMLVAHLNSAVNTLLSWTHGTTKMFTHSSKINYHMLFRFGMDWGRLLGLVWWTADLMTEFSLLRVWI